MPETPAILMCSDDNIGALIKNACSELKATYPIFDFDIQKNDAPTEAYAVKLRYLSCEKIYKAPLRLGHMIDDIFHTINAEQNKDVPIAGYIFSPKAMTLSPQSGPQGDKDALIQLTEKEKDILLHLYHAPDQTIDRQSLLKAVWGFGETIETHTAETHIYRLRQKIERDASDPKILTTTEQGYRLITQ